MKMKNLIIVVVSVLALVVVWLFINEREKAKRKDALIDLLTKENESLKIAYLELLAKFLKEEGTKAVKDLAKIVENKLKEKAEADDSFRKKPMLHNLLEHAKNCNWISSRQFENGIKLKEIRNKESHELAVSEESREIGMTIFAGIDLIYALK